MYICLHCGHHFDGDEIVAKHYDRATGTWDAEECPECGSEDFEEAGHCIKCDGYFPLDDSNNPENYMVGSICKDCVEKAQTFDNALKYGADRKTAVELNGFIAYAFSAAEIEEILANILEPENEHVPKDAANFCGDDVYDFSEWLEGQDG